VKRIVEPELLDELPPEDARAVRSRGDLRRLNWLMRHAAIFRATLKARLQKPPRVLAEIGAGDGTLMLKLASQMHKLWPQAQVILVDRHDIVSSQTLRGFQQFDWQVQTATVDAFDWLASARTWTLCWQISFCTISRTKN